MEIFDIYTNDREKTGETMIRGNKVPEGGYRLVIHVCIFGHDGKMLVQQRQSVKSSWPDKWDVSVGGCASSGDTSLSASIRELKEELGLDIKPEELRRAFTVYDKSVIDDYYIVNKDIELSSLVLQEEEVQAVKWADENEISEMTDRGEFIPYHKGLISILFYNRDHVGTRIRSDHR